MLSAQSMTRVSGVQGLKAAAPRAPIQRAARLVTRAGAVAGEVPDMEKRNIMNLLLAGAVLG